MSRLVTSSSSVESATCAVTSIDRSRRPPPCDETPPASARSATTADAAVPWATGAMAKSAPARQATPTVSTMVEASMLVSSIAACSVMKSAGRICDVHQAKRTPTAPPATDRHNVSRSS